MCLTVDSVSYMLTVRQFVSIQLATSYMKIFWHTVILNAKRKAPHPCRDLHFILFPFFRFSIKLLLWPNNSHYLLQVLRKTKPSTLPES